MRERVSERELEGVKDRKERSDSKRQSSQETNLCRGYLVDKHIEVSSEDGVGKCGGLSLCLPFSIFTSDPFVKNNVKAP